MDDYQDIEKYDRFLNDEMETEEKAAFEQEIAASKTLQQEIALHQLIVQSAQDEAEEDSIRSLVNEVKERTREGEQEKAEEPKRRGIIVPFYFKHRKVINIAASITLLAVFWWLMPSSGPSIEDEYLEEHMPETKFASTSIKTKAFDEEKAIEAALFSTKINGLTAFKKSDWEMAVDSLTTYLARVGLKNDDTKYLHIYLGTAYWKLNNKEETLKAFDEARTFSDIPQKAIRKEYVDWYVALGYLKYGKKEAGLEILKKLANSDSGEEIPIKAKELLKKLNQ